MQCGGDNAPDATIKGAVRAIKEIDSEIILIGNEEIINKKVKEIYNKENISEILGKLLSDINTLCNKNRIDNELKYELTKSKR